MDYKGEEMNRALVLVMKLLPKHKIKKDGNINLLTVNIDSLNTLQFTLFLYELVLH